MATNNDTALATVAVEMPGAAVVTGGGSGMP